MNIVKLFFIYFITSTILNAEYIRSIQLGSFPSEKATLNSLEKVNKILNEDATITTLMQKNDFRLKYRASGKYFISLLEPFRDKTTLQKVLNNLRKSYPDVYVKNFKDFPAKDFLQKEKIALDTKIIEEIVVPIVEDKVEIPKEIIVIEDNIEEVFEKVETVVAKESLPEAKKIVPVEINIALIIFLTLFEFIIIVMLIKFILKYKKENETHINKELIYSEKIDQLSENVTTKDQLLSHVSHELRTPVTAIMGLTHLVLESELSKLQKDYISKIESSSEHLLNLINDILDVSKMQAGELRLEKTEFNINDILEYVFNVNAIHAKRNNSSLFMDVALNIPSKVVGDSLRLGQILINLIGNAVKFTHNGEITLEVKKLSTVADSLKLEFSIIDTGIGMTKEQVNNIFDSYYQAEDSTTRKFGGTGLGLAISKELIEMMDGEIKVTSSKGKGTTFSFSVVLQLKDPENKRQYRLPSSSMLHKKILIVDSSNKNVVSLIKLLSYFNYKTNVIPSFEESVIESQEEFDIIIINQFNLTKQAVQSINSMKKKLKTKLVLINEIYSSINNDMLKDIGVDAFLEVPSTPQSILNMIVELYVVKNLDKKSKKTTMKDKLKTLLKKKILIAEDNDINQKVISGLLSQTGIELTFVQNGREVLDLLYKDTHFDLILMDINMPKMNGFEATKEIRQISKYNALPILALTGDVTEKAVSQALESGMQGHISKPIIIDIFYKKIFDVLSAKKIDLMQEKKIAEFKEHKDDGYNELSTSIGLARCDGDKEFYKSILKDFKSMYINSPINLEELCQNSQFKEARQKSMDIKDIALNIGAYNLCESAAGMEYEFEKGERSNWKELISHYETVLKVLFQEIDKYLKDI